MKIEPFDAAAAVVDDAAWPTGGTGTLVRLVHLLCTVAGVVVAGVETCYCYHHHCYLECWPGSIVLVAKPTHRADAGAAS